MRRVDICSEKPCERTAVEVCSWCYGNFCPFHVSKMHMNWRTRKYLVCKKCYDSANRYYRAGETTKFPPFPEHPAEKKPRGI